MLIVKTNPVGVDIAVNKFATYLHGKLLAKWAVDTAMFKAYGRCYRNKTDNGYIAENFTGVADKYEEVFWDSKLAAISFWGMANQVKHDVNEAVEMHLVFFVNLKLLKPSIAHRADEEVRNDVQQLFGKGMFGFSFKSIDLYLENVLREYPGSRRDDRLKYVDMHPSHCFRFNFTLNYNKNIC